MNILLVDDEQICISTISHILNNMCNEEIQIFTANSATDAMQVVEQNKIDLVFTDIRMPNTDGLELAKMITQKLPMCEIVILSAYDQKKYLKEAINLNVLRYLLKPINPTDIIEITNLVAEKHKKDKNLSVHNNINMSNSKIVEILISKTYQPQKLKIISDQIYDFDFFSKKYYTVGLIMTENNNYDAELSNIIQTVATQNDVKIINSKKNGMIIFIFSSNDNNLAVSLKNFFDFLIPSNIINNSQICIGNTVDELNKISDSYLNACILAEYSFYARKGIHVYFENINNNSGDKKPYEIALLNPETIPCYEEGFNSFLESTYLSLKKSASNPRKSAHIMFFNIINHMYIQAKNNGIVDDLPVEDIFYMTFLTIDDLYEFTHNFVLEHMLYLPINKMAYNIKSYIKQNYKNKDLSIEMIASNFYMSPQYIPKLFKKTFHISLLQYITNIRISAAKVLIETQDMGIKSIAQEVGYIDANYFSRLFKKKTGMTITKYKNKIIMKTE